MYGDEFDDGCNCHDGVCEDGEGLVKYEPCNTDIGCPFWSTWNEWSECIRNGDDEEIGHRRYRFCIDPQNPEEHLTTGQRECREHDNREIVPCYNTECPMDESMDDHEAMDSHG